MFEAQTRAYQRNRDGPKQPNSHVHSPLFAAEEAHSFNSRRPIATQPHPDCSPRQRNDLEVPAAADAACQRVNSDFSPRIADVSERQTTSYNAPVGASVVKLAIGEDTNPMQDKIDKFKTKPKRAIQANDSPVVTRAAVRQAHINLAKVQSRGSPLGLVSSRSMGLGDIVSPQSSVTRQARPQSKLKLTKKGKIES